MYDDDLNLPDLPAERLPADIRDAIFDSHFSNAEKGNPIPVRVTADMQRAMDVLLQKVQQAGGIPWLQTRSDLMRMGTFIILCILRTTLPNPPDALHAILVSNMIEGKTHTRKVTSEKLRKAIEHAADQIYEMRKDPAASDEVARLLGDLITDVETIRHGYWRGKWVRAIQDNSTLRAAIQEARLEERLADAYDTATD